MATENKKESLTADDELPGLETIPKTPHEPSSVPSTSTATTPATAPAASMEQREEAKQLDKKSDVADVALAFSKELHYRHERRLIYFIDEYLFPAIEKIKSATSFLKKDSILAVGDLQRFNKMCQTFDAVKTKLKNKDINTKSIKKELTDFSSAASNFFKNLDEKNFKLKGRGKINVKDIKRLIKLGEQKYIGFLYAAFSFKRLSEDHFKTHSEHRKEISEYLLYRLLNNFFDSLERLRLETNETNPRFSQMHAEINKVRAKLDKGITSDSPSIQEDFAHFIDAANDFFENLHLLPARSLWVTAQKEYASYLDVYTKLRGPTVSVQQATDAKAASPTTDPGLKLQLEKEAFFLLFKDLTKTVEIWQKDPKAALKVITAFLEKVPSIALDEQYPGIIAAVQNFNTEKPGSIPGEIEDFLKSKLSAPVVKEKKIRVDSPPSTPRASISSPSQLGTDSNEAIKKELSDLQSALTKFWIVGTPTAAGEETVNEFQFRKLFPLLDKASYSSEDIDAFIKDATTLADEMRSLYKTPGDTTGKERYDLILSHVNKIKSIKLPYEPQLLRLPSGEVKSTALLDAIASGFLQDLFPSDRIVIAEEPSRIQKQKAMAIPSLLDDMVDALKIMFVTYLESAFQEGSEERRKFASLILHSYRVVQGGGLKTYPFNQETQSKLKAYIDAVDSFFNLSEISKESGADTGVKKKSIADCKATFAKLVAAGIEHGILLPEDVKTRTNTASATAIPDKKVSMTESDKNLETHREFFSRKIDEVLKHHKFSGDEKSRLEGIKTILDTIKVLASKSGSVSYEDDAVKESLSTLVNLAASFFAEMASFGKYDACAKASTDLIQACVQEGILDEMGKAIKVKPLQAPAGISDQKARVTVDERTLGGLGLILSQEVENIALQMKQRPPQEQEQFGIITLQIAAIGKLLRQNNPFDNHTMRQRLSKFVMSAHTFFERAKSNPFITAFDTAFTNFNVACIKEGVLDSLGNPIEVESQVPDQKPQQSEIESLTVAVGKGLDNVLESHTFPNPAAQADFFAKAFLYKDFRDFVPKEDWTVFYKDARVRVPLSQFISTFQEFFLTNPELTPSVTAFKKALESFRAHCVEKGLLDKNGLPIEIKPRAESPDFKIRLPAVAFFATPPAAPGGTKAASPAVPGDKKLEKVETLFSAGEALVNELNFTKLLELIKIEPTATSETHGQWHRLFSSLCDKLTTEASKTETLESGSESIMFDTAQALKVVDAFKDKYPKISTVLVTTAKRDIEKLAQNNAALNHYLKQ